MTRSLQRWFCFDRSSHRRCSVKKVFLKIRNIQGITPVWESLFNNVAGHTYSEEHLQTAASAFSIDGKSCVLLITRRFSAIRDFKQ